MSALVAAGVYKWVDESGVVHYSDTPPAGQRGAQKIDTPPSSPDAAEAAQQRLQQQLDTRSREEQSRAQREQEAQQRQAQDALQSALKAESCGRARQELATLHQGRAFRYTENNERVFLDDRAWKAEIERLSAYIESQCGGTPEELERQQVEAERFKLQQAIEDNCVYHSDLLKMKERREAHTTPQELEKVRQEVDFWCRNATGDKSIILRRDIIRRW